MVTLTKKAVVEALKEIVQGKEDFVYKPLRPSGACVYSTRSGEPSCLVGQVFARLDPEYFESLHKWEYSGFNRSTREPSVNGLCDGFSEAPKPKINNAALIVLQEVQNAQDKKVPWGVAIEGVG